MFHNQKPNQYINRTQKILLRIVNKDHESSFNRILTIRQYFNFHQQNLQKFVPQLLKVQKNIHSEILK